MGKGKLRAFLKNPLPKELVSAQVEQKPAMGIDRDANRTLSFTRTPIETGACDQS